MPVALSCRPRWSASQITAGTIRATSTARAAARHGGSVGLPSTLPSRRRSSTMPGVAPKNDVPATVSTNQVSTLQ